MHEQSVLTSLLLRASSARRVNNMPVLAEISAGVKSVGADVTSTAIFLANVIFPDCSHGYTNLCCMNCTCGDNIMYISSVQGNVGSARLLGDMHHKPHLQQLLVLIWIRN